MTKVPDAWRQTHASTETQRARSKLHKCADCHAMIAEAKTRCGPCRDVRYQETVAANRHKYRGRKYGKNGCGRQKGGPKP